MEIEGSVALVTGANRGIGLAFARALRSRGAAKVYAGVRRPEDFNEPGLEPLLIDVTNHQHIVAAAAGTVVIGVHVGFVDTDATKTLDVPKVTATP
jgi:NAD(P)-dependent dehydrogenase (short-subunit alcohol dehydrogenase family)